MLAVFGLCEGARAASGRAHTLTVPGLNVTIDDRWVDGPGYRPLRIEIRPTAPVTADRTIAVEFVYRRGPRGEGYDLRVVEDIEVPAGAGPVRSTLAVPQQAGWGDPVINVFEDGALLDRAVCRWGPPMTGGSAWNEVLPKFLFVGVKPPDTSALAELFPDEAYILSQPLISSVIPSGLPTTVTRQLQDLPTRWIEYTCLDVVCLSADQLSELRSERREAFEAIVSWTAAGGNLWVYGLGEKWRRLAEVESMLGMAADTPGQQSTPTSRGWREHKSGESPPVLRQGLWIGDEPSMYRSLLEDVYSNDNSALAPGISPTFLTREFQMGMIVGLGPEDPFPGDAEFWVSVLNTMGPERWCWGGRHGLSIVYDNPEFWEFLIPGVGLAPTLEFCLLITLFVVVIGPVNYLLLRRWGRLHLLVITIPAGAALVTLLLYGYALIADGLGVKVRVRSVTLLDQRSGRTACWSRLSYYAGLTPSDGLRFPDDVAVLPLDPAGQRGFRPEPRSRDLFWQTDQWLARGWLGPRTPTQFVTIRSRRTELGLDFLADQDAQENPRVRNRLGTHIRHLVIRAEDGACYRANDIEAGAEAELESIALTDAVRHLNAVQARNRPQLPAGADRWRGPGWRRRSYGGYPHFRSDEPWVQPTQRTGRLESILTGTMQIYPGAGRSPTPGSYVAIVERSPEAVLGVESVTEKGSYHVIVGRW